jgi:hypothetical protein
VFTEFTRPHRLLTSRLDAIFWKHEICQPKEKRLNNAPTDTADAEQGLNEPTNQSLRRHRSMNTFSIQHPRPSIEIAMPAAVSTSVKAADVNGAGSLFLSGRIKDGAHEDRCSPIFSIPNLGDR